MNGNQRKVSRSLALGVLGLLGAPWALGCTPHSRGPINLAGEGSAPHGELDVMLFNGDATSLSIGLEIKDPALTKSLGYFCRSSLDSDSCFDDSNRIVDAMDVVRIKLPTGTHQFALTLEHGLYKNAEDLVPFSVVIRQDQKHVVFADVTETASNEGSEFEVHAKEVLTVLASAAPDFQRSLLVAARNAPAAGARLWALRELAGSELRRQPSRDLAALLAERAEEDADPLVRLFAGSVLHEYYEDVPVPASLTSGSGAEKGKFKALGKVEATKCRGSARNPNLTEVEDELVAEAVKLEGDDVVGVRCADAGTYWGGNCYTSVRCEGTAVFRGDAR